MVALDGARTLTPVKVVLVFPVYVACMPSLMTKSPVVGKPVVDETVNVVLLKEPPVRRGVNPVPIAPRLEALPVSKPRCPIRKPE